MMRRVSRLSLITLRRVRTGRTGAELLLCTPIFAPKTCVRAFGLSKDWRDYAGRTLVRCAAELRAPNAEELLAKRTKARLAVFGEL